MLCPITFEELCYILHVNTGYYQWIAYAGYFLILSCVIYSAIKTFVDNAPIKHAPNLRNDVIEVYMLLVALVTCCFLWRFTHDPIYECGIEVFCIAIAHIALIVYTKYTQPLNEDGSFAQHVVCLIPMMTASIGMSAYELYNRKGFEVSCFWICVLQFVFQFFVVTTGKQTVYSRHMQIHKLMKSIVLFATVTLIYWLDILTLVLAALLGTGGTLSVLMMPIVWCACGALYVHNIMHFTLSQCYDNQWIPWTSTVHIPRVYSGVALAVPPYRDDILKSD